MSMGGDVAKCIQEEKHCVYRVISGGEGKISSSLSPSLKFDIQPWLYYRQSYYHMSPSPPPPTACVYGDPHIVTLDGFKYTFNGHGEYDLIRTPQDQFTLQGRMEVPRGGSLQELVQATVFTAVVAKEAESDTVQIQLSSEGDSLELLMNGNLVDFSDLSEQEFMGVTVTDLGSDALSATFSSGVYVEAREANGIMSTLLVSAHVDYQGTTSGLMGNFNGEQGDDLVARGGEEGISLTSSLEDIHNLFGVTCEQQLLVL